MTPCALVGFVYIPCMNNHSHTDTEMSNAAPATITAKINLFETFRPIIERYVIEALTTNGFNNSYKARGLCRQANFRLSKAIGSEVEISRQAFNGILTRMVNRGILTRVGGKTNLWSTMTPHRAATYYVNESLAQQIWDNELHRVIEDGKTVRYLDYCAVEELMV